MQVIDQTLEDVVASLSSLDVDWMDDTARNNAMSAQLNAQHQIAKYSTLHKAHVLPCAAPYSDQDAAEH